MIEGAGRARAYQAEAAAVAAWQGAALGLTAYHNPKKFPTLEKFLGRSRRRPARVLDWRAVQGIARLWNAAGGGRVRQKGNSDNA